MIAWRAALFGALALVVCGSPARGQTVADRLIAPVRTTSNAAHAVVGPTSPVAAGFWSMFRHDVRHSGRTAASGPAEPSVAWAFDLGGLAYSSAATDVDGVAYVGAEDRVVAVNADGSLRWMRPMADYVISSPAIGANDLVVVGCRDGNVYALDQTTGVIRWFFGTGGEVWSSPVIGQDGTIYVGSFDGRLYALNPTTGAMRWSVSLGSEVVASPVITDAGDVVIATTAGFLVAVTPSGTLRWQRALSPGFALISSGAVSGGRVVLGSMDGSVYAVEATTGATAWSLDADGEIVSSPAVASDGTIYLGTLDGDLLAISGTGAERWRVDLGGEIISSPAVDGTGAVYVGTLAGAIVSLDAGGSERWRFAAREPVWSSPSFAPSGDLLISSTGTLESPGTLYRIANAPFSLNVAEPLLGTALSIEAGQPSNFTATGGAVFFRPGGSEEYQRVELDGAPGGAYEAAIPAEAVTIRGVELYVELTDGFRTVTVPVGDPASNPLRLTVAIDRVVAPDVFVPRRYRAVSIPVAVADATVAAVLEDDFGRPSITSWRLFRWNGEDYDEYPSFADDFGSGDAFLLITQDGSSFDVMDAESRPTDRPATVRLQPGWNLIGNPFAFPVALSDFGGAMQSVDARAWFDGTEMIQSGPAVEVLQPWDGIFLHNGTGETISIRIPPVEAPSDVNPEESLRAESGAVAQVRLIASNGRYRDSQTWLTFGDAPDLVKAPVGPDGVQLAIAREGERYARAQGVATDGSAEWTIRVLVPDHLLGSELRLTFHTDRDWPQDMRFDLRSADESSVVRPVSEGFAFTARSIETTLILSAISGDAAERPLQFELSQNYPNPFNPSTAFNLHLSADGDARVEIYDVLGRRVATLLNGPLSAGTHVFHWDGRDEAGGQVAGGVYFYRASSGQKMQTRTMVLLR